MLLTLIFASGTLALFALLWSMMAPDGWLYRVASVIFAASIGLFFGLLGAALVKGL